MNLAHRPRALGSPLITKAPEVRRADRAAYPLTVALYSAFYSALYPPFIFGP